MRSLKKFANNWCKWYLLFFRSLTFSKRPQTELLWLQIHDVICIVLYDMVSINLTTTLH